MRTVMFPCPSCKREHSLCYLKVSQGGGVKKVLGVNCDDSAKLGQTKFVRIQKSVIEISDLTEEDLAGIPEYETHQAKKASANRGNMQFALMYAQPGGQVERNVDLPRVSTLDAQVAADDIEANRLLQQLEQLKQAQVETQAQIDGLVRKRTTQECSERETRKELRKYWTMPLDLREA